MYHFSGGSKTCVFAVRCPAWMVSIEETSPISFQIDINKTADPKLIPVQETDLLRPYPSVGFPISPAVYC